MPEEGSGLMDTQTAIGIMAAPAIVAAVVGVFKPLLTRWLTADAIPPIALLLGIGYVVLAWAGGVIEAANVVVAILLGVTVGIAASGAREVFRQYRPQDGA